MRFSRPVVTFLGALVAVAVTVGVLVPLVLGGGPSGPEMAGRSDPSDEAASAPEPERVSGPVDVNITDPPPLVNPDEIISGGPPPDGIPPIDDPTFIEPSEVDFLSDQEPVLSVEVNGEVKAFPLRILIWHEIVNDVIGGVPVTVTYCPLCNTGITFERPTVDGRLLDFGTSGMLYRSNLVMWDRQTGSLWPQVLGQAVVGPLTGMTLEFVPTQILSWGDWREAHPGGLVLSQDTGFARPYGANPYEFYDEEESFPFLFRGEVDPRLPPKARVLSVVEGDEVVAIPYGLLNERAVNGWSTVTFQFLGRPVVVFWKSGTASALDTSSIPEGKDVGATGAFSPVVDGRTLTFVAGPDGITDVETGSVWSILGMAESGPLAGTELNPILSVEHFWFDLAAFFPGVPIVGEEVPLTE